MIFHKQADLIWEDVKPMLAERDFLRAEADRYHLSYIANRESANEVHENMKELISQVNEIRDEMKAAEEERLKVIKDHNQSVKDALKLPSEDEGMADSLASQLINSGSLTLGGALTGDSKTPGSKSIKERSILEDWVLHVEGSNYHPLFSILTSRVSISSPGIGSPIILQASATELGSSNLCVARTIASAVVEVRAL